MAAASSTNPANRAAWIVAAGEPLQVRDAPYPETIGPNEVVIRNHAVGLAIVDWYQQYLGFAVEAFPHIAGIDSAGVIAAVGSAVPSSLLQPGDRVLSCSSVFSTSNPAHGTWQQYTLNDAVRIAKLPSAISFNEGAVLPLATATAIAALFQSDTMALRLPPLRSSSAAAANPAKGEEEIVLVSGGSTSVALAGIQLLHAAGYTVASTASAKHHALLASLGVSYLFDRTSSTLVEDAIAALKGKNVVGVYETVGGFAGEEQAPLVVAAKIAGALGIKKVVTVNVRGARPASIPAEVELVPSIATTPFTVHAKLGEYIFSEWMAGALADGTLRPLPEPLVFGQGVEAINGGILRVRDGVSGQKVVIELP